MDEKRLLVLDDDAAVARTIAFVAGAHGFRVHTTSSSEDFFERVRTWAPNCLVIDLVMPSMDGLTLIRALRTLPAYADTPILMLTTEADSTIRDQARAAGAVGGFVMMK